MQRCKKGILDRTKQFHLVLSSDYLSSFTQIDVKGGCIRNSSLLCNRLVLLQPHGFSFSIFLRFSKHLLFLSAIRKKKITKRKTAGCRSEAKIFTFFLNKKNSLRSNSFLFLTEKCKNFFTLLHGGRKLMKNMVQKKSDNQIH